MKNLASIIALTASLVAGQAAAQTSTYYARSVIAPADEKAAPVPMQNGTPATTPSGSGAWTVGSWSASSSRCSTSAVQTRAVECVVAGKAVADSQCAETKPASTQTVSDLTNCTYAPTFGSYGACSASGVQTAPIATCTRSDGAPVSTAICSPQEQTKACGIWVAGSYGAPSSTCSASATQTRAVTCQLSGATVADAQCSGTKPETTLTSANYTACTYTATYSTTYGACSNSEQFAPVLTCKRNDGLNTDVPLSNCSPKRQVCTMPAPVSCNTFQTGQWIASSGIFLGRVNITGASAADLDQQSLSYCKSFGVNAVCGVVYTSSAPLAWQVTAYKTGTLGSQPNNGYIYKSTSCTAS